MAKLTQRIKQYYNNVVLDNSAMDGADYILKTSTENLRANLQTDYKSEKLLEAKLGILFRDYLHGEGSKDADFNVTAIAKGERNITAGAFEYMLHAKYSAPSVRQVDEPISKKYQIKGRHLFYVNDEINDQNVQFFISELPNFPNLEQDALTLLAPARQSLAKGFIDGLKKTYTYNIDQYRQSIAILKRIYDKMHKDDGVSSQAQLHQDQPNNPLLNPEAWLEMAASEIKGSNSMLARSAIKGVLADMYKSAYYRTTGNMQSPREIHARDIPTGYNYRLFMSDEFKGITMDLAAILGGSILTKYAWTGLLGAADQKGGIAKTAGTGLGFAQMGLTMGAVAGLSAGLSHYGAVPDEKGRSGTKAKKFARSAADILNTGILAYFAGSSVDRVGENNFTWKYASGIDGLNQQINWIKENAGSSLAGFGSDELVKSDARNGTDAKDTARGGNSSGDQRSGGNTDALHDTHENRHLRFSDENRLAALTTISHWHDNGTPATSEGNELGLRIVRDADGNYRFSTGNINVDGQDYSKPGIPDDPELKVLSLKQSDLEVVLKDGNGAKLFSIGDNGLSRETIDTKFVDDYGKRISLDESVRYARVGFVDDNGKGHSLATALGGEMNYTGTNPDNGASQRPDYTQPIIRDPLPAHEDPARIPTDKMFDDPFNIAVSYVSSEGNVNFAQAEYRSVQDGGQYGRFYVPADAASITLDTKHADRFEQKWLAFDLNHLDDKFDHTGFEGLHIKNIEFKDGQYGTLKFIGTDTDYQKGNANYQDVDIGTLVFVSPTAKANHDPVIVTHNLNVDENSRLDEILKGYDADNDSLTWSLGKDITFPSAYAGKFGIDDINIDEQSGRFYTTKPLPDTDCTQKIAVPVELSDGKSHDKEQITITVNDITKTLPSAKGDGFSSVPMEYVPFEISSGFKHFEYDFVNRSTRDFDHNFIHTNTKAPGFYAAAELNIPAFDGNLNLTFLGDQVWPSPIRDWYSKSEWGNFTGTGLGLSSMWTTHLENNSSDAIDAGLGASVRHDNWSQSFFSSDINQKFTDFSVQGSARYDFGAISTGLGMNHVITSSGTDVDGFKSSLYANSTSGTLSIGLEPFSNFEIGAIGKLESISNLPRLTSEDFDADAKWYGANLSWDLGKGLGLKGEALRTFDAGNYSGFEANLDTKLSDRLTLSTQYDHTRLHLPKEMITNQNFRMGLKIGIGAIPK